ncbi:Trk system potassium transporter TrkA [Desulfobaculum sp.]
MKVIIIGAGEVGFHIARRLSTESKEVVVIDKDANALKRITEYLDVQTVAGSGSDPAILDAAGVAEADVLLAVTDSDEINIIACTCAKALAPDIVKLARIRKDEYIDFQETRGTVVLPIDKIINPDVEVVKTIERIISLPDAEEVNEFADGHVKLIGLNVSGNSPVVGSGLAGIRDEMGGVDIIIAAIVRGEKLIIPSGEDFIHKGDLVYFVCRDEDLPAIMKHFGSHFRPVRDVLIIGGGDIGLRLAQRLERMKNMHVKLVDQGADSCQELAQILDRTLVLRGDGTDQELLLEENVPDMDMVISLTGDEETNILTSLLAKNLGAARAVTRIDKFAYFPLVRAIGIENTVSPRLSAVNSILQYMRQGKVLSAASIKGEAAEALEAVAQEHSDIVGKSVKDLHLPKGALILALVRGEKVIFPTGDTVIHPGDRIILLSTAKNISRVEKRLTVKLETF